MNIQELTQNSLLFFDGAMGTMLQSRGLPPGELPELYNLTHPDVVTDIHRAYVDAGADVISANTFQAHELKLGAHSVEDIVAAGISCARAAGARFVALDVGPLGQLLEPMGTLTFERAYEVFRRQMMAGEAAGADLIIIETVSDPFEAKAAILAAKENTSLPVICSMTFQADGRTFAGCDAMTAVLALQGLGVDALGVNCSLGPDSLKPVVETFLRYCKLPVIVQANAGLPCLHDGRAVYELTPAPYANQVADMIRAGVRIVGGCCGTTPEHIALLRQKLGGMRPVPAAPVRVTACTSGTQTVVFDGKTVEIGERLNPTGKKALQQALRAGDLPFLLSEAVGQVRAGAQVLDLNLGLPDFDECAAFSKIVRAIQSVTHAPLQIDSADPDALEAGLRIYNGKPIINSVNGKAESMARVLPLAKKYGALLVALTLDETGIPPTAQGRFAIAKRIRDAAVSHGIPEENLLIDCLVLTASAQQEQVRETLAAIRMVKAELGLKTVLGVSNVSFGLPNRELLNATFLSAALGAGLDAAILNSYAPRYREALDAYRVLSGEDEHAAHYIAVHAQGGGTPPPAPAKSDLSLAELIESGLAEQTAAAVTALLTDTPPLDIIDTHFIPTLNRAGARFESGELFLPQLMRTAQAVQAGLAVISACMGAEERPPAKGKILLATVAGDIHDIGKNIVKMLLETYGYEVIDLGKDVPPDAIVRAIRERGIRLAGLSALMTTTVESMRETIAAVRAEGLPCTFFVGGAVLTPEYAAYVGADHYARDAMEGVSIANRFFTD